MSPLRTREEHGSGIAKTPLGFMVPSSLVEDAELRKRYARQPPDVILNLPLDLLKVLPIDILDKLPGNRFCELPVVVLQRLSPGVLDKLPISMLQGMTALQLSILSPWRIADLLPRYPYLYQNLPDEELQMLAGPGTKAFAVLPYFISAEISKRLTDHPCLAPAGWQGPLGASPSSPRPPDLHRTPSPSPEDTDADVYSRLNDAERERDELRAEVTRLDSEKRIFIRHVRQLLANSYVNDSQPDSGSYHQILKASRTLRVNFEDIYREYGMYVGAYTGEEFEQLPTTVLDNEIQDLTTRLDEQTENSKQAAKNQERLEAENKRLQHLVEARAKEYQDMRRSQEERHSTTLQRLIKEHTTEMSEQMNVYEKELADLRVTHEREAVGKPEYEEELDRLLESIKSLGRKHLRNSEGPRSQDNDC